MRIGHGYDAHSLIAGRRLVLCGVDVPHSTGLSGHSDADVGTHALIDALLGAAALGDIGTMFPANDPAFKDADSIELLKTAYAKVRERGYTLGNCDVTIVAQSPKLAPYIEQMRTRLSAALNVDISQVSVKATTEEQMGFTGREEGIAATAVALIE
jgi:2-C-methyl-D-erythritol 2,4-cyclodiphosphate synthase